MLEHRGSGRANPRWRRPRLGWLAVLLLGGAAWLGGCVNRTLQIEQNALLPVPAAARMAGPLAPARQVRLQGDVAHGYVPPAAPGRHDPDAVGHTAVTSLLRGGVSWGVSDTFELSLWADYGHRRFSQPTVLGLQASQLASMHSLWFGMALRRAWPFYGGTVRLSWDLGGGRVPWTRFVHVEDDVLVDRAGSAGSDGSSVGPDDIAVLERSGWVRFENGYIRRSATTAWRTALFFDVAGEVSEIAHLHGGFGWQVLPFAHSYVTAGFACEDRAMPDERDRTCATDNDVDVFDAAVVTTLTAGADWDLGAVVLTLDAWAHVADGGTGAATAPFGMALGVRY